MNKTKNEILKTIHEIPLAIRWSMTTLNYTRRQQTDLVSVCLDLLSICKFYRRRCRRRRCCGCWCCNTLLLLFSLFLSVLRHLKTEFEVFMIKLHFICGRCQCGYKFQTTNSQVSKDTVSIKFRLSRHRLWLWPKCVHISTHEWCSTILSQDRWLGAKTCGMVSFCQKRFHSLSRFRCVFFFKFAPRNTSQCPFIIKVSDI